MGSDINVTLATSRNAGLGKQISNHYYLNKYPDKVRFPAGNSQFMLTFNCIFDIIMFMNNN